MDSQVNVLVVDDDTALAESLATYLAHFGFRVLAASAGDEMKRCLQRERIDVVVLDPMLRGADGLALAQALRAGSSVPLVMLSARCEPADRVVGLELGADDFVGKPFDPRELVARLRTVLRRAGPGSTDGRPEGRTVRFSGWTLDREERTLRSPRGAAVPLSNAEYRLLQAFLRAPQRVVSREALREQARGRRPARDGRSIDLLVSRLRQKLAIGDDAEPLISTVRGTGYRFDARLESHAVA